jgi:hypothetical protein
MYRERPSGHVLFLARSDLICPGHRHKKNSNAPPVILADWPGDDIAAYEIAAG